MHLIEIAPGVDLEKDILNLMGFKPINDWTPSLMDSRIFQPEPMTLKEDLMGLPLSDRLIYNPADNPFFVNFEGFAVNNKDALYNIRTQVETILKPIGKKVYTIVNYDNFTHSG